jgi:histidinol-phosphatase
MTLPINALLAIARGAARSAEVPILELFHHVAFERKGDGTEVTEADKTAERIIREQLGAAHPEASILGEEEGGSRAVNRSGDTWIIDPIDGTRSFITGNPLFGTLIALLRDGEPVLGVVHMPALGETMYATKGGGCWIARENREPVRCFVRETPIDDAYVGLTHPLGTALHPREGVPDWRIDRLLEAAGGDRWGGDCYAHAQVMEPWDIAALVPCIREAGGWVSDMRGETTDVTYSGSLLTAASAALAEQALTLLTPA